MLDIAKIGPFDYKICRSKRIEEIDRWGETAFNSRIIRLSENIPPKQAPITLVHELIHAVNNAYGLKDEEHAVSCLSHGLAQALQSLNFLPKEIDVFTLEPDATS